MTDQQIPGMGLNYGSVASSATTAIAATAVNLDMALSELQRAQTKVDDLRSKVVAHQRGCQHTWTKPEQKSLRFEGFTIPGDEPGTMGVDWRGETYVEPRTEVWWERYCPKCGLVERTKDYRPSNEVVPIFRSH